MKTRFAFLILFIGLLFTQASFGQALVRPQQDKGFSILGEVKAPNKFTWHEGMTLLRALVWVQGFTPKAVLARTVILRPIRESEYQMVEVDLVALMKGTASDVPLKADDMVIVPSSDDVFFVVGEASAPGTFELREGLTLRQAISLAHGITFNALPTQAAIYRQTGGGAREKMKIDLAAVMNGKQNDQPVLAGDVILLPPKRRTIY